MHFSSFANVLKKGKLNKPGFLYQPTNGRHFSEMVDLILDRDLGESGNDDRQCRLYRHTIDIYIEYIDFMNKEIMYDVRIVMPVGPAMRTCSRKSHISRYIIYKKYSAIESSALTSLSVTCLVYEKEGEVEVGPSAAGL